MAELSGLLIKAYRERLQLSQADFAKLFGISQSLISMVEMGQRPVSRRLVRQLRGKIEGKQAFPSFDAFLAEGGSGTGTLEAELGLIRPIPLEVWAGRVDLRKPADPGIVDRIGLPGLPPDCRAFRFTPPSVLLYPDTIGVFRPAALVHLTRDQVLLAQFRPVKGKKLVPPGFAWLGRAIVIREGQRRRCQFEAVGADIPVVELSPGNVEAVLVCCFRGRFCPP